MFNKIQLKTKSKLRQYFMEDVIAILDFHMNKYERMQEHYRNQINRIYIDSGKDDVTAIADLKWYLEEIGRNEERWNSLNSFKQELKNWNLI